MRIAFRRSRGDKFGCSLNFPYREVSMETLNCLKRSRSDFARKLYDGSYGCVSFLYLFKSGHRRSDLRIIHFMVHVKSLTAHRLHVRSKKSTYILLLSHKHCKSQIRPRFLLYRHSSHHHCVEYYESESFCCWTVAVYHSLSTLRSVQDRQLRHIVM